MSMISLVGLKFYCAQSTCTPFANTTARDIFQCEVACLFVVQCKALTFHQSTLNCEIFGNVTNQTGNMLADSDVTTMVMIDGTRFPDGE